jgi:16S rRNA (uracil1498-N3)-methyltransferase
MRDTRLHLDQPLAEGGVVTLDAAQTHYLRSVLRARPGQVLRVFNAACGEWRGRLEALARHAATLRVETRLRPPLPEPGPTLLFAPIKRPRLEWLLEKAVELGVAALQPVRCRHGVVDGVNPARLRQRLVEAVEQSERLSLPALLPEADLLEAAAGARLLVFADERGGRPLLEALDGSPETALLVGPEGGFDPAEQAALRRLDQVVAVSLGPAILRAETAALMLLACHRARAMERGARCP